MQYIQEIENLENILDSDEDNAEFVRNQRSYNVRQRHNNFDQWNDAEFLDRFRLSKNTILYLLEQIEDDLKPKREW